MKIAAIGTCLLLAACGSNGGNQAASANNAAAPAPNQAAVQPPVPIEMAPPPLNEAQADRTIPGPSDMADGLVGRWGRGNSCAQTMEFFADGRLTIPDGRAGVVRWRVTEPGRLELMETGPGRTGGFEVRDGGQKLRLTNPDGRVTDLIRC